MAAPEVGSVTRHVRAAVRTIGLRSNSDFDVSTIGPDTDLEALGVDSLIVGDLHARLKKAFSLTLDMRSYTTLKTPRVRQLVSIRRPGRPHTPAAPSLPALLANPGRGPNAPQELADALLELHHARGDSTEAGTSLAAGGPAPAPAEAESYSAALSTKGVDGVLDKLSKDAWSMLGY